MIKIIIEEVEMPPLYERKYKKDCIDSNRWFVVDTETKDTVYKGSFHNVVLAWHNLNKRYYQENKYTKP